MSQKRKSSTPSVVAFSSALSVGAAVRNQPFGNPTGMVIPAMKPSIVVKRGPPEPFWTRS